MLLISIVDLSSITMYGFRAECNGGGFYSVFYIICIISVMASRNLLWKFNSSGTKSSNFPLCILVGNNYFVCDSLKKIVVNILKLGLILILKEQCLLAVCDVKEIKNTREAHF